MPRAIAAALTPLRDDGATLDLDALGPYLEFLAAHGIDGVLLAGTTGEGMNLTLDERKAALERAVRGPLPVIAHCGAQTTAATVALCEHAAATSVEGVAVIAPPYSSSTRSRCSRTSPPLRAHAATPRSTPTS